MNLTKISMLSLLVMSSLSAQLAYGAIALDRTRVIYNDGEKASSLGITNESKDKPYLAQAWLENEKEEKINSPFIITPPVQRLEADSRSQVKIQAITAVGQLPQDRESVYYLNVREIPPRSSDVNVLQIALQTRIKLFYRPKSIVTTQRIEEIPQADKITMTKNGNNYIVNNPSPYFLTITKVEVNKKEISDLEPIMIAPFGKDKLSFGANNLGANPSIFYLNDFGGLAELKFNCRDTLCSVAQK